MVMARILSLRILLIVMLVMLIDGSANGSDDVHEYCNGKCNASGSDTDF